MMLWILPTSIHLVKHCGKLSETQRKLCISTTFLHQEIRLNFDILWRGSFELGKVKGDVKVTFEKLF